MTETATLQAVDLTQIFAKLCELETLLREQQTLSEESRELWTVKQVADYFQCTYEHAMRCIVSDPRFPAPVDIQGRTGKKSRNLYVSGEVVRFCLLQKKKKVRI